MDTDRETYVQITEDRRTAFRTLFYRYYEPLVRYSLTLIEDQDEAEDIVQDVFASLWTNRKENVITTSVKSYLYSCVKYRSINLLKHKAIERNHHPFIIEFLENAAHEEYKEEENRQLEAIRNALLKLPEQCRLVFTMSVLEGKTYREIAEELEISVNTVKSHILKAYHNIRELVSSGAALNSLLFLALFKTMGKF